MFETINLFFFDLAGIDLTPRHGAIAFGLILGLAFGVLAEVTRFCLRRAVAGERSARAPAAAVWLTALASALIGTQIAVAQGLVSFSDHRFLATDLPLAAIVIGGLLFGAGMVLTRGCASRLTVLAGTGNLRAVLVLLVFAIAAHAALKGVLAPAVSALSAVTLPLAQASLPGAPLFWGVIAAGIAAAAIWRAQLPPRDVFLAALLGLLVPAGWVGTGYVLLDEFDPITFESLAFTSAAANTLFWSVAATSIPAGFGTGLLFGVLLGAAISARLGGRFAWQSFETPRQTGRYMAGAVLMGVGGVLAGGCTIGAGLSGVPSLSIAALLALAAIAAGGALTGRIIRDAAFSTAAGPATQGPQPAA